MAGLSTRRLLGYYAGYAAVFVLLVLSLGWLERVYGAGAWISYAFIFFTIVTYAGIGLLCRTSDLSQYYVAGRQVPALFNGMATAADWMSAATFIGLAGVLYASGYEGFAYLLGWTGGYCLLGFLIAPYVRKFGAYTVPDLLAVRYGNGRPGGSRAVRMLAVVATMLCTFVYLIAQIQGVGLIVGHFGGVDFSVGVFFGLAGILVCSFLGGMRAVTWTQVAQYIVLIAAFLVPLALIAKNEGQQGVAQFSFGATLAANDLRAQAVNADPAEADVRAHFRARAQQLDRQLALLPQSYYDSRARLAQKVTSIRAHSLSIREIRDAERELADYPASPQIAQKQWEIERDDALARSAPMPPVSLLPAPEQKTNFLLLVFCLMIGTASLPHLLVRFYTTPSVVATRSSVAWALFFIALLYLSAPALAALVKHAVLTHLVGARYAELPAWIATWRHMDPPLLALADVNHDGIVQYAELSIHPDMIVLAAPEIAGLPYVCTSLVAAGALAAALSTADGLLLTIANSLSHDVFFHVLKPGASNQRRVTVAKIVLLAVALSAAYVTSLRPGNIVFLVGAAFSLSAASFFPVLVLGIFWKRATKAGALAGMLSGLAVTLVYIVTHYPFFTRLTGFAGERWFGVDPIASGAFGVPVGFAMAIIVSLLTKKNDPAIARFVDHLRSP